MAIREFSGLNGIMNPLPLSELPRALADIQEPLEVMVESPPGGELGYRSFAEFSLNCIEKPELSPKFHADITDLVLSRTDITADHQANLLRNALQYALIGLNTTRFPNGAEHPDQWAKWRTMMQEDPYVMGNYEDALISGRVTATIIERYAAVHFAAACFLDVLPDELTVGDIGPATGIALVNLRENLGWPSIEFDVPDTDKELCYRALAKHLKFKQIEGMDLDAEANWMWVESNSTYISQIGDAKRTAIREAMYKQRGQLKIVHGDLTMGETEEGVKDFRALVENGTYNLLVAVCMYYEILPHLRRGARQTADTLTDGLQVVVDTAKPSRDGMELVHAKHIYSAPLNILARHVTPENHDNPWLLLGKLDSFHPKMITPSKIGLHMLRHQASLGLL